MKKALVLGVLVLATVCHGDVVINEMMSINTAGLAWVELRNTGSESVDVSSWRIAKDSKKWKNWTQFPADTVIAAGGYLLVYINHALEAVTSSIIGGDVHVGLDGYEVGDVIAIAHDFAGGDKDKPFETPGAIASRLDFGGKKQYDGVSYGVDPNDSTRWLYFTTPTPGAANGNDGTETYGSGALPTVSFDGFDRPRLGVALSVLLEGDGTDGCVYEWTRKEFSAADAVEVVSTTSSYTPSADDLEHWLQIIVSKGAQILASKRVWVSKLPVVYIDTDDGLPIVDKSNYKSATLEIQGNVECAHQYSGSVEIKGRGNTSWLYPQKPYKLKLGTKADVFGFGKNKHWVLLPNFVDRSMLRNEAGSSLAKELGILGMDMTSVVVIVNGEYCGVYEFGEHLRVAENRVDIFNWDDEAESVADSLYDAVKDAEGFSKSDKSALESLMDENLSWITSGQVVYKQKTYKLSDYGLRCDYDLTGGYLFEMSAQYDEVSKFKTTGGLMVMVNTPEFLMTDASMMSEVKDLWNGFEEACKSYNGYNSRGRHFSDIADLDSMVSFWLVNEILDNSDSHWNSRYAYKDVGADKLRFGPVWDFDCGGGSISTWGASEDMWRVTARVIVDEGLSGQNFFRDWVGHPEFCWRAYELWHLYARPWLSKFVAEGGALDEAAKVRKEAGLAHDAKWKDAECQIWGDDFEKRSVAEDVAIYKAFLQKRLKWLDQQFSSYEALVASLNAVSDNPHDGLNFTIEYNLDGGAAGALSPQAGTYNEWFTVGDPYRSGYVFAGWKFAAGLSPATAQYTVQEGVAVDIRNPDRVVLPPHGWVGFRNVTTESCVALEAVWAKPSYRVAYNLNGGKSGALAPTSAGYHEWLTVTDPVRKGYSFAGWKVEGGLSGGTAEWRSDIVDPLPLMGAESDVLPTPFGWIGFRYLSVGDDVTLSAQWVAMTYEVNYVLGDGGQAGALAPDGSEYNGWLTIKNPSRLGYRFGGWKVSGEKLDLENAEYRDNAGVPLKFRDAPAVIMPANGWLGFRYLSNGGKVVFAAQWIPVEYDVQYELAGGTPGRLAPTNGSYYDWLTVTDPSKTGYRFVGWKVVSGLDLSRAEYRGDVIAPIRFSGSSDLVETPYQWAGFRYLCDTGAVVLRAEWVAVGTQVRTTAFGRLQVAGGAEHAGRVLYGEFELGVFCLLMSDDGQTAYLHLQYADGTAESSEVSVREFGDLWLVLELDGLADEAFLIDVGTEMPFLSRWR